jgi:hypothetical protein
MAEVGDKLVGQFAACLSEQLGRTEPTVAEPAATEPTVTTPLPAEPIDLLRTAGPSVAKRALAAAAAAAVAALVVLRFRRRRGSRR